MEKAFLCSLLFSLCGRKTPGKISIVKNIYIYVQGKKAKRKKIKDFLKNPVITH